MAVGSMHFAYYYLLLLAFCIGKGDGQWKKSDKDNLERDIKLYKKISERLEHELQEYYAEYEDHEPLHFKFNGNNYETNTYFPKINVKLASKKGREKTKNKDTVSSTFTKVTNDVPIYNKTNFNDSTPPKETSVARVKTSHNSKWPKFEDILLAIGKKYDWKNDRWIKVKEKLKIKNKDYNKFDNSVIFHEKHRFSYKTIKLNRGKNKRNVVIAVTAIR